MKIWAHKAFAPVKQYTPVFVSNAVRSVVTAFIAPIWQASRNGHIRSSFHRVAMDRNGAALPWYTYPAIFQLDEADFHERDVLEFGGGQSTIWWAQRARSVLCFDDDSDWCKRVEPMLPSNASMKLVEKEEAAQKCEVVKQLGDRTFDVVVIDGLHRVGLVPLAASILKPGGFLLFDNSHWQGLIEAIAPYQFQRVDYYGGSPGVPLQACTSLFFAERCFVFEHNGAVRNLN